jgi:transcriptional regulator with XRE-family HTH domain
VINRIRDIRKQKGMTLAEVAAACTPPTTAQTIGRLETGMRNLSLVWMNRIASALGVDPSCWSRARLPRSRR